MAQEDLWGDLPFELDLRTPLSILREQADLLNDKAQHVIEADLDIRAGSRRIEFDFDLKAPALGNYIFTAFTVRHPITIYPVQISSHINETEYTCNNEDELIGNIREILTSNEMRRIIASLVSQSRVLK